MSFAVSTHSPSSADPLLAVHNLTKRFILERDFVGRPTRWLDAVNAVSLEVREGETLALVGESGSGKSTLGRLLLRLISATAGSIYFRKLDVIQASGHELRSFRQQAQIIFQDPMESLDPRMKGSAIVAEGMNHLGLDKVGRRSRIAELLELVQLPADAAERLPHEFSGGQRQRLSIARALAVNPTFIVADEPVSALDVSMQSQVLNLMRELQTRLGLTYLFISHDMSVIRHMADRVAVMYLGNVVEIAPADELFANPRHPYTQVLLSSVPSLLKTNAAKRIEVPTEGTTTATPGACPFAPRCFRALDICRTQAPPLAPGATQPEHFVACFNPGPPPSSEAPAS